MLHPQQFQLFIPHLSESENKQLLSLGKKVIFYEHFLQSQYHNTGSSVSFSHSVSVAELSGNHFLQWPHPLVSSDRPRPVGSAHLCTVDWAWSADRERLSEANVC